VKKERVGERNEQFDGLSLLGYLGNHVACRAKGRAKWDAWSGKKRLPRAQAMQAMNSALQADLGRAALLERKRLLGEIRGTKLIFQFY